MKEKTCPYCDQPFLPSRYHPEQQVCSAPKCQQRRRANYHRKKLAEDPAYRDDCERSRADWRERNPDYAKVRRAKRRASRQDKPEDPLIAELQRLLKLLRKNSAKKDSALQVSRCPADLWLIESTGPNTSKKYLAVLHIAHS
jgi:hypothetical protein